MENKNGRGIFLGVVSVATLIVAIIGATFAYFVASTAGNNGTVAANSVNLAGTLDFQETPAIRNDLIPVADSIMRDSYALASPNTCTVLSAAGGTTIYGGCSTYTFTVTNTATVAQTIYIKLTPSTNTFTNLHYALFTDAPGSGGTAPAAPSITGQLTLNSQTPIDLKTDTLAATGETGDSVTYTLAIWIHEISGDSNPANGGDQTAVDAGKSFTGTINVSSSDGSSYITGVITQS